MNWRGKITRNWVGGSVGALLAVTLGLGLRFLHFGYEVPLGQGLIAWSYDLLFPLRVDVKTEGVVIIYLDEDSRRVLGQPYGSAWDRALLARLLQRLKDDQAKLVVMDIVFSATEKDQAKDPEWIRANHSLAAALRENGKVILGADYGPADKQDFASVMKVFYPLDEFRTNAAALGIVLLASDPDFGIRQYYPGDYQGPDFIGSLSWKAAELLRAQITQKPRQQDRERWLNYYGPPKTLPWFSFHLALNTTNVLPGTFRDKVVFVGKAPTSTGYIGEKKDDYRSPYSWWVKYHEFSSGVEIQATGFLNLVRQDGLTRLPAGLELALLLGLGLAAGFGLALCRPVMAVLAALGAALLIALLSYLLFWRMHGWSCWLLVVVAQIPAALLWAISFNSVKLHIEKQVMADSLALHISKARVKQILNNPELLRPSAEQQEISILFSDIVNFTGITARMEPGDLFKLLNKYFETTLAAIHEEDGTIIQLMGDAIFAIWNAPFLQPNQQQRACRAALKLRDQLVQFDVRQHSLPLRTRVGLHTGFAYVGNIGSTTRFDYTAIGDSINLASRLEGLNKYLGTDLLATRDIQKMVEGDLVSRLAGHFKLKGFERVVEVHELVDNLEKAETSRPWRASFADALYHFQRASFDDAEAGFRRTLELRPHDGPSLFYLERIKGFRMTPPRKDWAGEVEIGEK